jgi:hypothetical protein
MFAEIPAPSQATLIGWSVLSLGTLAALASSIVSLYRGGQVQRREVTLSPEVMSKEQCHVNHLDIDRRISHLESGTRELWNTMRTEDAKTREALNQYAQDTERALGRIEGKLDDLIKTRNT